MQNLCKALQTARLANYGNDEQSLENCFHGLTKIVPIFEDNALTEICAEYDNGDQICKHYKNGAETHKCWGEIPQGDKVTSEICTIPPDEIGTDSSYDDCMEECVNAGDDTLDWGRYCHSRFCHSSTEKKSAQISGKLYLVVLLTADSQFYRGLWINKVSQVDTLVSYNCAPD